MFQEYKIHISNIDSIISSKIHEPTQYIVTMVYMLITDSDSNIDEEYILCYIKHYRYNVYCIRLYIYM